MRRPVLSSMLLGAGLLLLPASSVLADDPGAGLTVEPDAITAGQTILLAGNGLEPDDERIIVLQGESLAVSLGTATTDADGMLSQEIPIPAHLPSGTYQLQAIGDETLEIELKVTAAEGGAVAEPPPVETVITNRDRAPLELGLVLVLAAAAAAVGAVLVGKSERFGGRAAATAHGEVRR